MHFFYFYLSFPYCLVCVLQPCGHLLRKGWPIGPPVYDVLLCLCHFTTRCAGSVLDCIASLPLPSSLLGCTGIGSIYIHVFIHI